MITLRRTTAPSRDATAPAKPPYTAPIPEYDPGREAYLLLGPAWRSSTARLVETGHYFDVVRTPQQIAAPVLDHLRAHGERLGAVSAEDGCWSFFVPLCSGRLPWPYWVSYLSGPRAQIPPRAARGKGLRLQWITRGEPTGRFLTDPDVLCPTLIALAPPDPRSGPWLGPTSPEEIL
ncbi:hypothetical protein ACWD3I_25895 [Streptomyces sp. NPDC002817]|uniref:hypothetical protein n=1 Tax=Streptomyces sp. NPDC088357 TaxID=3154655 RepID=UPI003434A068